MRKVFLFDAMDDSDVFGNATLNEVNQRHLKQSIESVLRAYGVVVCIFLNFFGFGEL
jgi:hypothetical protein